MRSFNKPNSAFIVSFGLLTAWSGIASATTIQINATNCSFDEAVMALNTQRVVDGCPAGNGQSDAIKVPAGTFIFGASTNYISRSVVISGASQSTSILQTSLPAADGFVISIAPDPSIGLAPSVTFQNLTLKGTDPNSVAAAISESDSPGPNFLNAFVTLNTVSVTGFGGGFQNLSPDGLSQATIINSVFNNTTSGSTGPAILNSAIMTIQGSTIENNEGGYPTPGIYESGGTLTMIYSTVENDYGFGNGGALYVDYGSANISHSTFYNNTAENVGGAIALDGSTQYGSSLQLNFVTIADNNGNNGVGGLFENDSPVGPITLGVFDSVIAANIQGGDGAYAAYIDVYANFASSGLNLIGTKTGAFNAPSKTIFNSNPMFGTFSHVDSWPDTLPLLPGSPAIDKEPGPFSGIDTLDERGFPRPLDGNADGTASYDLGAFEFDPWQIERLTVAAKSSSTTYTVASDTGYSNQQGGWLESTATNNFVTFTTPIPTSGTYDVKVRAKLGNNRGKYQLSTATSLTGTYTNQGSAQDLYTSASNVFTEVDLGNVTFSSGGNKYFKFLVTGKNASSSGYYLTLDYIKLTKH